MKIGIVGLGLIGGSLGLDLRSQGHQVLGSSRRRVTCEAAIVRGVVDEASIDVRLLAAADLIFICTPIAAILPTVKQLVPHLAKDTVLTDVGSVKTAIVEAITPIWSPFVGGHPMAGKAESGLEVAQSHLFAGNPYVLTPTETTPSAALEMVAEIAQSLQAQVYRTTPAHHDRAVAWISHLPAFASASLIAACLEESDTHVLSLAQEVASSGFRDTSRVGGGNPELARMMAQYNQQELLRSLHYYRQALNRFIAQIESADWATLETQLQKTQQLRPKFIKKFSPDCDNIAT